ncbi:MAG TPA: tetratricopeptide repeat protein, partial [Kofleriaceae bacterium]
TDAWQDNHLAWYATASAHLARQEWTQARAAVEHAVTLRPDRAMYQLYHGIALYEAERQRIGALHARGEPAQNDARPLHAARAALAIAVERAPDLWRAHYYLGRVYRDLDDARRAAEQFTLAIKLQPGYRLPYIALCELYRRWDYVDQALAVAMLGTTRVPPAEAAELWFEVGMAHDARHADDLAIDAFGRAIASGDDALPKLQRGQIYLRKGDLGRARRDLEDLMQSVDPRMADVKPLVATLLAQIARGQRSAGAHWDCSHGDTPVVCRAR